MLAAAARWQVDEREGERGTSGFAFLLNGLELGLIEEALNVVDAGFVVRRLRGGTGISRGKGSSPGTELKGLGSAEPGACLARCRGRGVLRLWVAAARKVRKGSGSEPHS